MGICGTMTCQSVAACQFILMFVLFVLLRLFSLSLADGEFTHNKQLYQTMAKVVQPVSQHKTAPVEESLSLLQHLSVLSFLLFLIYCGNQQAEAFPSLLSLCCLLAPVCGFIVFPRSKGADPALSQQFGMQGRSFQESSLFQFIELLNTYYITPTELPTPFWIVNV